MAMKPEEGNTWGLKAGPHAQPATEKRTLAWWSHYQRTLPLWPVQHAPPYLTYLPDTRAVIVAQIEVKAVIRPGRHILHKYRLVEAPVQDMKAGPACTATQAPDQRWLVHDYGKAPSWDWADRRTDDGSMASSQLESVIG